MGTPSVVPAKTKPPEPKILVVDDDPEFLHRLCGILRLARYHVLSATDYDAATRILNQSHRQIGLAIIDLVLPGEHSGFDLIGFIARRPASIKILATSAIFKDPQLYTALRVGADAVLHKPPRGKAIPEAEWLKVVRDLLPPVSTAVAG